MIKPLNKNIIFQFLNQTSSQLGMFKEVTESGIEIVSNHKDSSNNARWAKVCFIGPNVNDIAVDDYILIEPLQWTDSIKYESETYWKTDESKIMCISQMKPDSLY